MFGDLKSRASTCSPDYPSVHRRIVDIYNASSLQQQAVYQIVTDVTQNPEGIDVSDFEATHFVRRLIEQLLVHGTCLWRPGKSSVESPEIFNPFGYYIEQTKTKYVPRRIDGTKTMGQKWHLIILEPPRTEFSEEAKKWITVAPTSCAMRAVKQSLALEELMLHRRQRNLHNSQPTVFVNNAVEKNTAAITSWANMYKRTDLAKMSKKTERDQNFFTGDIGSKMQTLARDNARITTTMRNSLRNTAPLRVGHTPGEVVDESRDGRVAHAEMFITEGTNPVVLRHLEGDAHEATIQRDITYALLDAYHVPPGKFGLNRNTERMAGNLLISQQPIETYELFIRKIIEYVNAVLEVAGAKLRYAPTMQRSELEAIKSVLTPKAAKRLYSKVFKVDESDIDSDRLLENTSQNSQSHKKKSPQELAASRLVGK